MTKRVKWGSKVAAPLYIVSVAMVLADWPLGLAKCGRLGTMLFLGTMGISVAVKLSRIEKDLMVKIDESVGAVWDAGGRAARRQIELEQEQQQVRLAVVHKLGRLS